MNKPGFPVLYGSPDLELCVHECRSTVEDNLFVAKLMAQKQIKLLDLSALLEEENTELINYLLLQRAELS